MTRIVLTVVRPFQQMVFAVHSRVEDVWKSYVDLVDVRKVNRQLRAEITKLRRERSILLSKERENRRLRKLLNLKGRYEFPSVVAQIVGEDASGWYRTFIINQGSDDGVFPMMPVTVAEGVVGRVVASSTSVSSVLLITDPDLSLDCRVARTRDRGVLSGYLDRGCILRYVNIKGQVRPGDEVVTSGLDGIFPRGLTVGKVDIVRKGPQGLFLEAMVKPAADFSEIEEVLVILRKRSGFDVQPGLERRR